MAQTRETQYAAFLRGINVGAAGKGRKSVPMPELRALALELDFGDPETYLQSGNLIFVARGSAATAERKLEAAITEHFGFEVPVMVRPVKELARVRKNCPFEEAAIERAKYLHIGFAKQKLKPGALELLEPYCVKGERIALDGESFWVDYPAVMGSKVTPAVLNRFFGSPVTMRNTKTLDAVVALG